MKDIRDKIFKECPECGKETKIYDVQKDYIIQKCKDCEMNWKIKFKIEEI